MRHNSVHGTSSCLYGGEYSRSLNHGLTLATSLALAKLHKTSGDAIKIWKAKGENGHLFNHAQVHAFLECF